MDILKVTLSDDKEKLIIKIDEQLVKKDYILQKYSRTNMEYVTQYLPNSPIEAYAKEEDGYVVIEAEFNKNVITKVLLGALLLSPSKEQYLENIYRADKESYTALIEQILMKISSSIYATEYKNIGLNLFDIVEEKKKKIES